MDPIIQAKLDEARKLYPDESDQLQLNSWEKELKKSSLYLNLRNHDAFKIICESYYTELLKINKTLQDDPSLFATAEGQMTGRLLHERKRFIKDFLRPFEVARVTETSVKDTINKTLDKNNEN